MTPDLTNLTSVEIRNLSDERERELQKANEYLSTVVQERLRLQRQIIEIQLRKKDLEIAEEKATHVVRSIRSDLNILENAFWAAKNSGT